MLLLQRVFDPSSFVEKNCTVSITCEGVLLRKALKQQDNPDKYNPLCFKNSL